MSGRQGSWPGLALWVITSGTMLWAAGCGDPPRQPIRPPLASKARLFGDPSLVPTRAGERARAELALASDLREATSALAGVHDVVATVRLRSDGTIAGASLVLHTDDRVDTTARARAIAAQVLGPAAADMTVESVQATATPPPPAAVRWPLLAALLGLGFSLGVSFDRGRVQLRRWKRSPRRKLG